MATPTTPNLKPATAQPKLGGARAWFIWAIVVVFVLYLFNVQTMFSVVQGQIQNHLKLTVSELTIIAGVYTWAFAIFQFFGGALLDSFGSKKVLIPAMAFVTIGVFLYGTATSYPMIILAQVVMALGACCGFVGAGYIGGVWFGMAAYGTMFGYVETSSSLSSAIQQPITNWVLSHTTYEHMFVALGFFGIALVVLALLFVKNPTKVVSDGQNPFKRVFTDLWKIVRYPQVWIAAIWGGIAFGLQLAVGVVWAPKMLTNLGFSADAGNLGSALCWAGLGIGSLFWPAWSTKMNNRKVPSIIGMAIVAFAFLMIIFVHMPLWLTQVMMFLIGLGATAEMIAFMVGSDVAGGPLVGTSSAFVNAFMFIIGGILENVPSKLAHTDSNHMFIPFLVVSLVAIVLIFIQKETAPKKAA